MIIYCIVCYVIGFFWFSYFFVIKGSDLKAGFKWWLLSPLTMPFVAVASFALW